MTNAMNGLRKTFKQEDTSVEQYRIVTLGTGADEVVAATDATAHLVGVTDESANATAGNPVGVLLDGIVKVTILAATTKGAKITATTAGKGAATTTATDNIVGTLLETTTVANQVAQVQLDQTTLAA